MFCGPGEGPHMKRCMLTAVLVVWVWFGMLFTGEVWVCGFGCTEGGLHLSLVIPLECMLTAVVCGLVVQRADQRKIQSTFCTTKPTHPHFPCEQHTKPHPHHCCEHAPLHVSENTGPSPGPQNIKQTTLCTTKLHTSPVSMHLHRTTLV